ncbi:MAG: CoA-binding protein [Acidimicrobiia bacterium]|nr:CoA-binding protein [Acidimicrobiia bacterium]
MADITDHLRDSNTVIAVVGATDAPWKYGGKIYCDLKAKGFQVRAVNPNRETVDGDSTYPNLASVPDEIDIVDVVVPPEIAERIVADAAEIGLTHFWLQPGAESQRVIELAEAEGLEVIHHQCIMVRAGRVG